MLLYPFSIPLDVTPFGGAPLQIKMALGRDPEALESLHVCLGSRGFLNDSRLKFPKSHARSIVVRGKFAGWVIFIEYGWVLVGRWPNRILNDRLYVYQIGGIDGIQVRLERLLGKVGDLPGYFSHAKPADLHQAWHHEIRLVDQSPNPDEVQVAIRQARESARRQLLNELRRLHAELRGVSYPL